MSNIDKRIGASLVREIAYTLKNPSERESQILEQWARAFVTTQILGLDPTLKNFQATRLREKEFILDTDFVLRCLTSNVEHSQLYHLIIDKLKSLQCRLYIPEEVRKEIDEHVASARSTYSRYGERVTTYFDEIFKTGIPNVFIEDYVNQKNGAKSDLSFDVYIRNYQPQFLSGLLQRTFGNDILTNSLPTDKLDNDEVNLLTTKILPHTESTYLGEKSTDERNREISRVDALLYLVAKKKNQGTEGDKLLSRKTYLVTRTTRSIRAAKECGLFFKNIICNPDALMAILKETGNVDMNDVKVINLFENPFLTYVARELWNEIGPFVKEKAVFTKYEKIEALRHDVDECLDQGISGNPSQTTYKKRIKEVAGIYLPSDIERLKQDLEKKNKQLEKKDRDLEKILLEYESLQKENRKQKSSRPGHQRLGGCGPVRLYRGYGPENRQPG